MNVVVVIATYNEAENIRELLRKLTKYTVVIVDDNSPDGTAKIAEEFGNTIVEKPKNRLGIAQSYKRGFEIALGLSPDYVIQMDAGMTHDPSYIAEFIKRALKYNYLLVYGSRFSKKTKILGYRTVISLIAKALMKFIQVDMEDATCGFRCWKPELLSKIVEKQWLSKKFGFQLETATMAFRTLDKSRIGSIRIPYKLTNSSFNIKTLLEAIWIYSILFLS